MITLYIKTHRVTGLKYFGKTTADDPVAYKGSGKHWLRHIKKHGYDCDTEIYLQSECIGYITREALRFSRAYDIVNSDLWANLQEENGIDGWTKGVPNLKLKGVPRPDEVRKKVSESKKGSRCSEEHCKNISKSKIGVLRPYLKGIGFSEERVKKMINSVSRTWKVVRPDGNEQIIHNLYKFCKENALDSGCMSKVASGKRKDHKGWKCEKMK